MLNCEEYSQICTKVYSPRLLNQRVRNLSLSQVGNSVKISANPGLNFNLGFLFFFSKIFSRIIFSILFRATNHQIVGKKNKTEFTLIAVISEFKFALTPAYLYPALNYLTLYFSLKSEKKT